MRFRNSLRLLIENFKNVYKLLAYKIVIGLIAGALTCAFVLPELMRIIRSDALQQVLEDGKRFITAFFELDAKPLNKARDALFGDNGSFKALIDLLASMQLEIILVCVGCVVVYLLKRFTDTLCHFATGKILNDKMATYADTTFSSAFISSLGKASVYAVVYVPVVFLFDVITIAICVLMLKFLPVLLALFLSMTLIVVCQSLKLTFTSTWLPAMTTDDMRLRDALRAKSEFEKKQKAKVFSTYLVTVYLILIVNIIAALCTFGSALLITVPASYYIFICQQYVNYYTMQGKKYFITYEKIEANPDHGDTEHYFSYIDDESKSDNGEKQISLEEITTKETAQESAVEEAQKE